MIDFFPGVIQLSIATSESDDLPRVGVVALKLPPFWPESAEVWFAQAEAQFNIKGIISSTTKFYHCVASMSQEGGQAVQAEPVVLAFPQPHLQLQLVGDLLQPFAGITDLTEKML